MTAQELIAELERFGDARFPVLMTGGGGGIGEVVWHSTLYGAVNWVELVSDECEER